MCVFVRARMSANGLTSVCEYGHDLGTSCVCMRGERQTESNTGEQFTLVVVVVVIVVVVVVMIIIIIMSVLLACLSM